MAAEDRITKAMTFLQKPNAIGEGKTTNVYDHLGRIIDRIVNEHPKDALGVVEVLSRFVKEEAFSGCTPLQVTGAEELQVVADYGKEVLKLDTDFLERDADGKVSGPKPSCAMPDYMVEADGLAWAGAGFSDMESYKVMCSIRNLATRENEGIKQMRFWGKILGTESDYYIVEAEREAQPDYEVEKEGETAPDSKALLYSWYAYYAANDLCGAWTKLPDLRPRELRAARQIRKLFSGKLDAKVITHPYFDGTEASLLRAQIALISADTVLGIKGMYLPGEDEPLHLNRISMDLLNPEWKPPPISDFANPATWVHHQPHILKSGLTLNEEPADEMPEKEAKEEYLNYLIAVATQEADPKRDLQRSLVGDGLLWTIKQSGDGMLYSNPLPGTAENPKGPRSNVVTYVRSVSWPGAVTVLRGEAITNFYVGYGWPAGKPDFYFCAPPDIQEEPNDQEEQQEPVEARAPDLGGDPDP